MGVPQPPCSPLGTPAHSGSLLMHNSLFASRKSCSFEKKASGLLVMGELLSRDPGAGKAPGAAVWPPAETQGGLGTAL